MAKREDNLKPFTSKQSREEAVKNGTKGGIASGEARRKKRDLRLAIEMLLETDIKGKDGEIKSGAEAIAIAQFKKALKGDTKAFEVLRDTAGQKPVEKVEQVNIDAEYKSRIKELKEMFADERNNKSDPKKPV